MKQSESSETLVTEIACEEPVSIRELLTFPIVMAIANDVSLTILNFSIHSLLPLLMYVPIQKGGLGLDPQSIGYLMGIYGAGSGAFQLFFFSKLVRRFGTRRTFIFSVAIFIPAILLFPVVNLLAKAWGLNYSVWIVLSCVLVLTFMMDTGYGKCLDFI